MTTCKICKTDLPPGPEYVQWHDACKLCKYCNNEVGRDIIEKLIKQSDGDDKVEIYHFPCHQQKLENDFKTTPVTITQAHLDYLNSAAQMFEPNMQVSILTNQKLAGNASRKFVHEKTVEEIFMMIRRMEAIAAEWNIALNKEKTRIENSLRDLERVQLKDLQNSEERVEFEQKRIKKREREALKLSPELRAREKAISAFMKLMGMDRETAERMHDSQSGKGIQ